MKQFCIEYKYGADRPRLNHVEHPNDHCTSLSEAVKDLEDWVEANPLIAGRVVSRHWAERTFSVGPFYFTLGYCTKWKPASSWHLAPLDPVEHDLPRQAMIVQAQKDLKRAFGGR